MLCYDAGLFRAFLCLVAQRKGMVIKMKKTTSAGVFQLPNGTWGFRYAYWIDGKQKDIKRTKDENGNPFKTERA